MNMSIKIVISHTEPNIQLTKHKDKDQLMALSIHLPNWIVKQFVKNGGAKKIKITKRKKRSTRGGFQKAELIHLGE